jgi:perosamine synthetase
MTDMEAAIGLKQLQRLDQMVARRRRNAKMLNQGLRDIPGIIPQQITAESAHAWHQYCVVVDREIYGRDRDALAMGLNHRGISTGVHYPRGLHRQPIFQELYGNARLPKSDRLAESILALPVHHGLSNEDIEFIIATLKELAG